VEAICDFVQRSRDGAETQPIKWRRSSWETLWHREAGLLARAVLDLIKH
jgi:hypothetical protein